MGEIGISRHEFLHVINFWEAQRIKRGYRKRERTMCLMIRRQTFWMVKCSLADTAKIRDEADLWKLPWDEEDDDIEPPISDEDQQELQDLMASINAQSVNPRQ